MSDDYKTLYDQSPIGLWRTSIADGKFLHANAAAEKIFGYSQGGLEGHFSTDFYDCELRKLLLAELQTKGIVRDFELKIRRPDGSIIWASISAVIHPDQDYIEGCIQDITSRKIAEEEQAQLHWQELEKITKLQQNIKKKIEETEQISLCKSSQNS